MRFSLWLYPYVRWGDISAMGAGARRAEELGFASISVSDHIICPTGPIADGVTPVWHDFFVLATYIAAATSTIRIVGTLVLPYRRLLPMAKQIASVDQASGGRFTLVACTGWLEQEFELLGVPFAERGAITDEYLRAMRILWTEERPRFEGKYASFSDIVFEPKCVQTPHVPIWIGGSDRKRPIDRMLELGDGWMPMGDDPPERLGESIARIKDRAHAHGRDPDTLEFRYTLGIGEAEAALRSISHGIGVDEPAEVQLSGSASDAPEEVAEVISRFADAGFDELCLSFAFRGPSDYTERIEWFASEVMPLVG
jgi:probable F420-dependent oxidoreductase